MVSKEAALFDSLMSQFPPEMLRAFGLSELPMSTVEGYTALVLTFGLLVIAIFAAILGFQMITKEESSATADFLLSKPISRFNIFASKYLVSMISMIVVSIVFLVSVYFSVELFKGDATPDTGLIVFSLTSIFFISYFFFGLSLLLSTFIKKLKNVISPALGISVLFYSINGLAQAIESDTNFNWNPFTVFDFSGIYIAEKLPTGGIIYAVSAATITIIFSYLRYYRKDIASL